MFSCVMCVFVRSAHAYLLLGCVWVVMFCYASSYKQLKEFCKTNVEVILIENEIYNSIHQMFRIIIDIDS